MRLRRLPSSGALLIAAVALVAACSSPSDDNVAKPPQAPVPQVTAGVPPGSGKVLETMDAGTYTYVRVDLSGTDVWAAGPKVAVKVGDTVTLPKGTPMQDFRSATLNRTFPLVYFVGSIGTDAAAPGEPAAAVPAHNPAAAAASAPAAAEPVARIEGGKTVEEIVTQCAALAGTDVAVRARVVKFSAGIMGANWLHIRDGSGAAGTNDLTVTTDAVVAVGDTVVVRGKVTTDKDFGSGYRYAVILEKAAVEKQ